MRWRGRVEEGGQGRGDEHGDGMAGHNAAGLTLAVGLKHHASKCVTSLSSAGIVNNIID